MICIVVVVISHATLCGEDIIVIIQRGWFMFLS
jgi:hypothetical protein